MTAAVAAPAVQAPPSMAIQANEALARGELALADSLCREALRRSPRDVVALCVSGHVALALQRFHHAQVFFGRAQALQPQSTDIADWLARAREIGQAAKALAARQAGAEAPPASTNTAGRAVGTKCVIQTFKPSGQWYSSPPGLGDFIRGACHVHEMLDGTGIELRVDLSRTGFAKFIEHDPALLFTGTADDIAEAEEFFNDEVALRLRLQAFLASDETELYVSTNAGAWNRTTLPERTRAAMQPLYRFTADIESELAQGLPVQDYEVLSIRCGDRFYGADGRPDDVAFRAICALIEHDVLPAAAHPVVITSDCHELKLDLAQRFGLLMLAHRSRHGAFDDQVRPVAVDMCLLRHSRANHHINAWAGWWSGFSHYTSMLSGVGGLNFRAPHFECEAVVPEGGLAVSPSVGMSAGASLARAANDALGRGNLALADDLSAKALAQQPDDVFALCLRGHLALGLGRHAIAAPLFARALERQPDSAQIAQWLETARAGRAPAVPGRLLLAKAWGGDFWTDVDHVLGQALLAELSGRTPVVHWGANSRFGGGADTDAFAGFFEPLSDATLAGDCQPAASFFPAKWNAANLRTEGLDRLAGAGARMSPLHLLARDEAVVVGDFKSAIGELLAWIEPGSEYHGLDADAVRRRLAARYLRPQPALCARIEQFQREHLAGRRWLAVHARGDEPAGGTRDLAPARAAVHARVDARLAQRPELGVLLVTDSDAVAADFRARHGAGVTVFDLRAHGVEAEAVAAYVAADCDAFVGAGAAMLSASVRSLKEWPADSFELIGQDIVARPGQLLHRW